MTSCVDPSGWVFQRASMRSFAGRPGVPAAEPGTLILAAVHLGGIANLAADEGGLELRLSDDVGVRRDER